MQINYVIKLIIIKELLCLLLVAFRVKKNEKFLNIVAMVLMTATMNLEN